MLTHGRRHSRHADRRTLDSVVGMTMEARPCPDPSA
jgi:hypothetical protein